MDWQELERVARREACRWVRSSHDVDDVIQEALMRAWRHQRGRRGEDPRPWVRQIVRREVWRLAERRRRIAERELCGGELDGPTQDSLETTLTRLDVERALRALDPTDRALLHGRYALDLTQPAVAAALNLPEGTAKVRLHRLRRKLALALG